MAIELIWLNKCRYLKGLQGEKSNATMVTSTIKKIVSMRSMAIYIFTLHMNLIFFLCVFPRTLKSWRHVFSAN